MTLLPACSAPTPSLVPTSQPEFISQPAPTVTVSPVPNVISSNEEVVGGRCPMASILSDPSLFPTRMYALTQTAVVKLPQEITVAQAAEALERGAYFLDVREPDEWEEVHIVGAHPIALSVLSERSGQIPRDAEIIVVCRTGFRSAQARDLLRQAGFTNVTSMMGGIDEWQAQGLPVVNG